MIVVIFFLGEEAVEVVVEEVVEEVEEEEGGGEDRREDADAAEGDVDVDAVEEEDISLFVALLYRKELLIRALKVPLPPFSCIRHHPVAV